MCLDSCYRNLSVRKHKKIPSEWAVPNLTQFQDQLLTSWPAYIGEECKTTCRRHSCFEESFQPFSKSKYKSIGTKLVKVFLHIPNSHQEIRYSVKTTLITLVVNIGSSLSWWTGLSVLGTLTLVSNIKNCFTHVVVMKQNIVFQNHSHAPNISRIFKVAPLRPIAVKAHN